MKKKFLITFLSLACVVACTFGLAACGDNDKPDVHTHEWSQSWEKNETHHWHECTVSDCTVTDDSQKDGYGEHDLSHGECVCGYKPEVKAELSFTSMNDDYYVDGIGTVTDSEIVVPSEYAGKPVTGIDKYAFANCSSITSVTLPDSITHIGWNAFENCSNLTSINLPDGLPYISDSTFKGCSSLASISLPDSITIISNSAFSGCNKLTEIAIPDGVTRLGNSVFKDCSSLTEITIPSGVEKIYFSSFSGCSSLSELIICGDDISIDGETVFEGCPIETATVPARVCSFINNPALNTVVITGGERIYDNALENCGNLTSITVPVSVKYIGDEAFINCKALTSITYGGTKEQWYDVRVGSNWSYQTGDFTVRCTDGEIAY